MIDRIADGRTDLIFEFLARGHPPDSTDGNGVPLILEYVRPGRSPSEADTLPDALRSHSCLSSHPSCPF
jgi:hypothetical protein